MMAPPEEASDPTTRSSESDEPTTKAPSLARLLYARRAEYLHTHRLRVRVGTWNVAAQNGTHEDLASWFCGDEDLDGLDRGCAGGGGGGAKGHGRGDDVRNLALGRIGLYVLGLQEIVDLNNTREYVVYADPTRRKKWVDAVKQALPDYNVVVEEQMTGLLLLVLAAPDVFAMIGSVDVNVVGTGFLGYLGNKGAVGARVLMGESARFIFVNSHLASGPDEAVRRVWDVDTIRTRMKFGPVEIPGGPEPAEEEHLGSEDFAFWFGDLNFRMEGVPGDQIRHLFTKVCTGEYILPPDGAPEGRDASDAETEAGTSPRSPSSSGSWDAEADVDIQDLPDPDDFEPDLGVDPTSLQAILDSLRPHDQLHRLMEARKVFHDGWQEGPLRFLPTYKYDVRSVDTFDTSLKQRAPSWCDRILYRSRKHREAWNSKLEEEAGARKRDEEMRARGIDKAAEDDDLLFEYDPERDADDGPPKGKAGIDYDEYDDVEEPAPGHASVVAEETLGLDLYTSHQRICSSDHKPVSATFTLEFEAAAPDLKAAVHAEVARELDRVENEGRPGVTVVGDSTDHPSLDFGDVTYRSVRTKTLTIANTGSVPARCSFVDKSAGGGGGDDDATGPRWFAVGFLRPDADTDADDVTIVDPPQAVEVHPGDTVTVRVRTRIEDMALVRELNARPAAGLEEVLVLRVHDGKDHFVPVRGTWKHTSFGRPIEELIRIPEQGARALRFGDGDVADRPVTVPFPKELEMICEAVRSLAEQAVAEQGMVVANDELPRDVPGWPFSDRRFVGAGELDAQYANAAEALDNHEPLPDALAPESLIACAKLEIMCRLLEEFLSGMKDGIISPALWAGLPKTLPADREATRNAVLDVLQTSPHHHITFVFLVDTLSTLCALLAPTKKPGEASAESSSGRTTPSQDAKRFRAFSFRFGAAAAGGVNGAPGSGGSASRLGKRERHVAGLIGRAICRADRETPAEREKMKAILEASILGHRGEF